MIYHSIQSDDCLCFLILENKKKKTKTPEYKVPFHFQCSEQQTVNRKQNRHFLKSFFPFLFSPSTQLVLVYFL